MNLAVYHDGSIYVATRSEIFRLRDKDGDGKADERTPHLPPRNAGQLPAQRPVGLRLRFRRQRLLRLRREPGGRLQADRQRRQVRSPAAAKGATSTAAIRTARSSAASPPASGTRSTSASTPSAGCSPSTTTPTAGRPAGCCTSSKGATTATASATAARACIPSPPGTASCPARCRWSPAPAKRPAACWPTNPTTCPSEYRGDLLVTSWGDHRLERYRLKPRGASFSAEMTPVVRGGENFRPVGIALAPDGSLYFSDWVDKSYNLHGKGRVWRL